MGWILDLIDNTSAQATLYIDGKPRYTTIFGVVMSIVASVVISALSAYFFYQFLNGNDMTVLYYSQSVANVNFDYNLKDKMFMFSLLDTNNQIVSPQYLTFLPRYNYQSDITGNFTSTTLETEPCEYGKNLDLKWNASFGSLDGMSCMKQTDSPLTISNSIQNFTWLNVYVQKCQNTTENTNHCFPMETIDNYLATE